MKQIVTLLALFISSFTLQAQQVDFMGFPSEVQSDQINQVYSSRQVDGINSVDIVKAFPSPVSYTSDVAFDGELLWVTGYGAYKLFGLDPEDGSVVETIDIDFVRPYGMTYSNGNLFVVNNDDKVIVQIDRETGLVLNSFSIEQEETYPTGLEIIDGTFWFNDPRGPYPSTEDDQTVKFNPVENSFEDYTAVGEYPSAIAFDGNYLWSIDNVTQTIHQIEKGTLQSVRVFETPGGIYPNGLTFDGEFMWISNNDSDSIYQIRLADEVTAVHENFNNETALTIFPSVANEVLNINLGSLDADEVNIECFNMQGQHIASVSKQDMQNNTLTWGIPSELANGVYICSVQTLSENISKKFIVKK